MQFVVRMTKHIPVLWQYPIVSNHVYRLGEQDIRRGFANHNVELASFDHSLMSRISEIQHIYW